MPRTSAAAKPATLTPLYDLDAVRLPTERFALIAKQIEDLEREKIAIEVRNSDRLDAIATAIAKGLPEPPETPLELRAVDQKLEILHLARGKAADERESAIRSACRAALEATRPRRLELARDVEAAMEALESAEAEVWEFERHMTSLGYAPHIFCPARLPSFGLNSVRAKLRAIGEKIAEFSAGVGN